MQEVIIFICNKNGSRERRGEEREYTERATEDLLLKVLEKEFREAMKDVFNDRRKITDPDVCNIFNLWYLRNHVNEFRKEMREGFKRIDCSYNFISISLLTSLFRGLIEMHDI